MSSKNNYDNIIAKIFENHYQEGITEFEFDREEFVQVAQEIGGMVPKNLGDINYSFRFRKSLPDSITSTAPEGQEWHILLSGRGHYRFVLSVEDKIIPTDLLAEIRIPDSTPGLISLYAYSDEQALLAILRYNRLLDIFTGKTCYSLQNHLRTTVPHIGQVETDEVYVGLDQQGTHYVFPVQAKGHSDKIGLVQIEQDLALCEHKFNGLVCVPIAAQFMERDLISMFSFKPTPNGIRISAEVHYRLVPAEEFSNED